MADQLLFTPQRVLDTNAQPGAGYVARFFVSGTTTPLTVYTDSTLGTAHGTSVTADASGVFPAVWAASAAKVVIEDADGATVATVDPVAAVSDSASDAAGISFAPSVNVPETNVQDAIDYVFANAASATIGSGIGVTGNTTLLADLDATGTASGVYRFDGTTTGTYPTGVAAADTGHVTLWRETASSATQTLYHDTTDRVFFRRMASTSWGTWREIIIANQGAAEGDILYRAASAWTRLAKGTAGQRLQQNNAATAPEWGAGYVLHVREQQASGTDAGTFTSGAWQTRVLNTTPTNTITGASLASNQVTLPAGTYRVEASAPGVQVNTHKLRLRDTTGGTTLVVGNNATTLSGNPSGSVAHLRGQFTLAGASVLELQHWCNSTKSTNGLGASASSGEVEVYAEAFFERIA